MSDLISRQDAIEVLEWFDQTDPLGYTPVQIVRALPTAEPRWIPVTEKLPKAEKKVLICTKRGTLCCACYEDGTVLENDSSWQWYDIDWAGWDEEEDCGIIPEGWWEFTEFHPDCEFDCPVDETVIAWMPLPEPYKGGEE